MDFKKIVCSVIITFVTLIAYAQKKGTNELYFDAAMTHYNDNKRGIVSTGTIPGYSLSAINTIGGAFTLQYERITKHGFVFGGGFSFGFRPYKVVLKLDVDMLDTNSRPYNSGQHIYLRESSIQVN